MKGLLLSLLFLLQGIPIQQEGKVSGVLRDGMGMPLFGVRVAAVARGDFRLQIFGHSSNGPTVTIEDQDLTLELKSRRLY